MARREVTVVINGEEFVSKAAKDADEGLNTFSSKVPGYAKVIAGLTIAFQAVQAAIGKVRDVVVASFDAYDALATSQRKLEGTSKIAGVSMDTLNGIATRARTAFQLSTITANELANVTALMGAKAGDAGRANQLLASALDIGAARGMDARDVMDALNITLRGQDEGLDRLVNANPSVLYKEWADAAGVSVGKMDDQQKMLAIIEGLVQRGTTVGGEYTAYLGTAQGKQALLNQQLEDMRAKLGEAMQPFRAFAVDTMNDLIKNAGGGASAVGSVTHALVAFLGALRPILAPLLTLGTILVQTVAVGAEYLTLQIRRLSGATAIGVGMMIKHFGDLAERGGKFLRILGIDVVADTGAAMRKFGEEMVLHNARKLEIVEGDALAFKWRNEKIINEWMGNTVSTVQKATEGVEKAVTDATPKTNAAAAALGKGISDKIGEPLRLSVSLTQGAIERLSQAARDQLPPERANAFNDAMDSIRKNADGLVKALPPITQGTNTAAGNTKDMAREVEMFARGALGAAESFGVIDDAAARSLNSAISIASAIGSIIKSGFSFAGVTGVIGGVASLVSGMMASDAERRRLLRENSVQLQKLREEGVTLSTKVSGEKLSKLTQALSGDDLLSGEYFADKERSVLNQLAAFGLSLRDLEAVATEYGIQGITKNGKLNDFRALRQLIEALQIGGGKVRVGQSFSDQLQFFRDTQSNDGADGLGALQGLVDFLRNVGGVRALDGIDVMADPQAAASRLRGLFAQLSNGGIDSGAIGRLTGSQFSGLLMELIRGLTGPAGATAPTGGGDVTVPTGTTGAGGPVSVPTATIQDVIKASTESMTAVLTVHTALHERIAAATEGSYMRLTSIDNKMDTLIDVTAGNIEATDAKLEAMRRLAALERGERPVLG